MHSKPVLYGFALFFVIFWLYTGFIQPILIAPVGGLLSPLGALATLITSLVLAFVWYWLYAFAVRKTGAEPEA